MEGSDFTSMMTQLGLMNKVSTGYPLLDILVCLLVPFLLQRITPWLQDLAAQLSNWRRRPGTSSHTRTIIYQRRSDWITTMGNSYNYRLQEAVLFKINIMPHVVKQMVDAEAQLLTSNNRNNAADDEEEKDLISNSDNDSDDNSDCSEWYDGKDTEKLEVSLVPPVDVPIMLTTGIHFTRNVVHNSGDGRTEVITTFTLIAAGSNGAAALDEFLQGAFDEYRSMLKGKPRDRARYLYMPVMSTTGGAASSDDNSVSPFTFRRYKLSEDKTFQNFFHPQKHEILNLVDNFTHKRGKFGIAGYPHKLGFLLWGPPGTGKTSFIKALAQATKRSIVNIPLARIKTNQELMDLMFAQSVQVQGESSRHYLPFHKVIFVMEDVDAASSVVQRRAPPAAGAAAAAAAAPYLMDVEEGDKGRASNSSTAAVAGPVTKDVAAWLKSDDALNLAGLLNILDGVVDTPGRIVIMTSNHPEKLDPALIRPGRINKKIYMGHLLAGGALSMVRHYFDQVSEEDVDRLTKLWRPNTISPATLESMCAEHDSVDQLLAALEDLESLKQQQLLLEGLHEEAKQQMRNLTAPASANDSASIDDEEGDEEEEEGCDNEDGKDTAEQEQQEQHNNAAGDEQEQQAEEDQEEVEEEGGAATAPTDCQVQVAELHGKKARGKKARGKEVLAAKAVDQEDDLAGPFDRSGRPVSPFAAVQQQLEGLGEGNDDVLPLDRQPSTPLRVAP